jgi:hypothetical protein
MPARNRSVAIVLAGTVLVAVLVIIYWTTTAHPAPSYVPLQREVSEPAEHPSKITESAQAPHSSASGNVGASVSPDAGDLLRHLGAAVVTLAQAPPHAETLVHSVAEAIRTYTSENHADFDAYCTLHGIVPISLTAPDPDAAPYMWSLFHSWFKTSIVKHDELAVRWRVQNGVEIFVDDTNSIRMVSRDNARAFWMQAEPRDRNSIEVVFPIVAQDLDGVIFESRLGLEFGYNPATSSWVLLRSRQYDVPAKTRIVEAPV